MPLSYPTTCAHSPGNVQGVVTAKTQYILKKAREYFEEHLCVGGYYEKGQCVAGEWIGVAAERLELSGKVRAEDFLRLCENQYPGIGDLSRRPRTGKCVLPAFETATVQQPRRAARSPPEWPRRTATAGSSCGD